MFNPGRKLGLLLHRPYVDASIDLDGKVIQLAIRNPSSTPLTLESIDLLHRRTFFHRLRLTLLGYHRTYEVIDTESHPLPSLPHTLLPHQGLVLHLLRPSSHPAASHDRMQHPSFIRPPLIEQDPDTAATSRQLLARILLANGAVIDAVPGRPRRYWYYPPNFDTPVLNSSTT